MNKELPLVFWFRWLSSVCLPFIDADRFIADGKYLGKPFFRIPVGAWPANVNLAPNTNILANQCDWTKKKQKSLDVPGLCMYLQEL
jgi:hypothetical protein